MAKADDSYTSDGQQMNGIYYPEPDLVVEDTNKLAEKEAKLSSSLPILDDLIEWFDTQVDLCDSLDNILLTSMTINGVKMGREVSIEGQLMAYQMLKEMLETKRKEFEDFKLENLT